MPKPAPPTIEDAETVLRNQIAIYRRSHTNLIGPAKGKIIDKGALHTIACLRLALKIVVERKRL